MKVVEYLVDCLVLQGVTDVFGIPGGVVLDFLYALDRDRRINVHLSYHEQGAAFEACGYAQYQHKLGVAYATRGPGFTNLITGIADAYADSLPVLFITAHSGKTVGRHAQRFEKDQEMDTVSMVKHITKYSATVEDAAFACEAIQTALWCAMNGRKGPVFLDFFSGLWNEEIEISEITYKQEAMEILPVKQLAEALNQAKRPVLLAGDGIRQANAVQAFAEFCKKTTIPVLSSRCSQDVGAVSNNYYGYVGSHGIRYSNFIFAKADLIIALGNRLGFPLESKSFNKALENKKIIRIDTDSDELKRKIPNTKSFKCDVLAAITMLTKSCVSIGNYTTWLRICDVLKEKLKGFDTNEAVIQLAGIFKRLDPDITICCDVGNNEFWVSRAYVEAGIKNRILYSKSFGALGCGLPKAIGAALASHKPILCIVGDQGLQLNLQELQLVTEEKIPVCVLVINNYSSGMIRSKEKTKYGGHYLHTTLQSGYGLPDITAIAKAYNIQPLSEARAYPSIVELFFDEDVELEPSLPIGRDLQDMTPALPLAFYQTLNEM